MKITSVKVSQNAHFDFLSVLCTARVLQPSFFRIHRTVFSETSMLNLTKSIRVIQELKVRLLLAFFHRWC